MNRRRIAILIDGGFFLRRLPRLVPNVEVQRAEVVAGCIRRLCRSHVSQLTGADDRRWLDHIYRIFYYDAHPYSGKAHHPIRNTPIDYQKTDQARQRLALFDALRRQRKLALRLGKVTVENEWSLAMSLTKPILRHRQALQALVTLSAPTDPDSTTTVQLDAAQCQQLIALRDLLLTLPANAVSLGMRQKGVDMRIGIDIAALALKQQVDSIVLVAGDSDFVPAAKLARREGVDFVLDPLWQQINDDLHEHIDGLQCGLPQPRIHPVPPEVGPALQTPET